mmetsp:Transcript_57058/g.133013  ORF Transcript_57058/g.133013 Transcript_57058/m.133013 type:complete len:211 (+) Transcript_57058:139-771(+)
MARASQCRIQHGWPLLHEPAEILKVQHLVVLRLASLRQQRHQICAHELAATLRETGPERGGALGPKTGPQHPSQVTLGHKASALLVAQQEGEFCDAACRAFAREQRERLDELTILYRPASIRVEELKQVVDRSIAAAVQAQDIYHLRTGDEASTARVHLPELLEPAFEMVYVSVEEPLHGRQREIALHACLQGCLLIEEDVVVSMLGGLY